MNLGLGQAAWTKLFRELGLYDKPIKDCRDLSRKFDAKLSRIQLRDNNGSASLLSGWVLAGVVIGTNTDELGKIFPRVTKDSATTTIASGSNAQALPQATINVASTTNFASSGSVNVTTGAGVQAVTYTGLSGGNQLTGCSGGTGTMSTGGAVAQATVNLYTAVSASGLVATAGSAYPGTAALLAANSSGLTGSVAVGSLSGSEAVDTHYLTVFLDYVVIARSVLDGTQIEHGEMLSDYLVAIASAQSSIQDAIATMKAAKDKVLAGRVSRTLNSSQPSLINLNTKDTSGAITTDYSGVLEDLRAAMADETSPSAQTVLKNALSLGSASFASTNDGVASLTGTLAEFASAGTITATCSEATRGSEKFTLTQRLSGSNSIIEAKNVLTIDQSYADPTLGVLAMLLKRTLTLSVGSSNDFGAMSNWTLTGLSSGNTDTAGKLYPKVITGVIDNTKWIMQLYSSSTLSTASLVSQSAEASSSATGVVLTAQNGSGLAGVVAIGSSPTNAHSGTVNCNFFQVQNSSKNVADSFTVAITQASAGEIQDIMRATESYALNSASSNPTISDGLSSASTFAPFVVRDV